MTDNLTLPADYHSIRPHNLRVSIDPRIELLAVVQQLAGYGQRFPLLTPFDIQYKTEIDEAFLPLHDHQVIKLFDQMSDRFHADAPPAAMLHLSAPPELIVQVPFTDYLIERAGDLNQLEQFLTALRGFTKESKFMDFYQAHTPFYETIAKETAIRFSGIDDAAVLENYYGIQQHSYNLILAPLFNSSGYGPRVCRKDGLFDLYCITGSSGMDSQKQPKFRGTSNLRSLLWHEFSHSFVNPLTEKYLSEVNQYQTLFQPIAKQMTPYGYGTWEVTVKEHIVRAVTVRLAARELGEAEGDAFLKQELEWGFDYIDLIVERLKWYEEQRGRYPTFRDFYPELIKGFDTAERPQKTST